MKASFTVDVEEDVPPFFKSFIGVKKGLPKILSILDEFGIKATFFVTAELCEKFPNLIRNLAKKHEIACHGFRHERIDKLKPQMLYEMVLKATNFIRDVIGEKPVGFRAPYLKADVNLLYVLKELGYRYDSSSSIWYPWQKIYLNSAKKIGIRELPVTIDDIMIRILGGMSFVSTQFKRNGLVLDMHPWNAINIRHERLERREIQPSRMIMLLSWIGTGEKFLENLRKLLMVLSKRKVKFVLMKEL